MLFNCGVRSLTYFSLTIKQCCTVEHFSRERIRASSKLDQLGYHLPGASITGGKYLTSNSSITAIPVLMSDAHRRRPRPRSASNAVARYFVKLKGFRRPMQFSWKDNKNNRFMLLQFNSTKKNWFVLLHIIRCALICFVKTKRKLFYFLIEAKRKFNKSLNLHFNFLLCMLSPCYSTICVASLKPARNITY